MKNSHEIHTRTPEVLKHMLEHIDSWKPPAADMNLLHFQPLRYFNEDVVCLTCVIRLRRFVQSPAAERWRSLPKKHRATLQVRAEEWGCSQRSGSELQGMALPPSGRAQGGP